MRPTILSVLTVIGLSAPAAAIADSGAISNVAGQGSTITATVTVESTSCRDYGYGIKTCTWFAFVTTQPANTDCAPTPTTPVWVTPRYYQPAAITQTVTYSNYAGSDQTLCLYIYPATGDRPVALARAFYTAPPPPAPVVAPTGATPETAVRQAILTETGRVPAGFINTCTTDPLAAICQTSWRDRTYVWAGQFTLGGHTALFSGARAARSCTRSRRVRECARPVTFVVSAPAVALPPASSTLGIPPAPTTTTFGSGQGSIGLCGDGTISDSIGRQGACSHHGGVANP
jgi:hypothetical protein